MTRGKHGPEPRNGRTEEGYERFLERLTWNLTPTEVRTFRLVHEQNLSKAQVAMIEGATRQAIYSRLESMKKKRLCAGIR